VEPESTTQVFDTSEVNKDSVQTTVADSSFVSGEIILNYGSPRPPPAKPSTPPPSLRRAAPPTPSLASWFVPSPSSPSSSASVRHGPYLRSFLLQHVTKPVFINNSNCSPVVTTLLLDPCALRSNPHPCELNPTFWPLFCPDLEFRDVSAYA
jgi:hypothetical protein